MEKFLADGRSLIYRPIASGVHGVCSHPPHRPQRSTFWYSRSNTFFRVHSVKVKDAYTDNMFSLWDSNKQVINLLIEEANSFHSTIKFTAEISENTTTFVIQLPIMKGDNSKTNLSLTFVHITSRLKLNTHFTSRHPNRHKKRFLKGKLFDF